MFPRHSRLWLAGIFFLLALLLLAPSMLLLPHSQQELPLPPLKEQPRPVFLEPRMLHLNWPLRIRVQDRDTIILSIVMDEQGRQPTADSQGQPATDIFSTHNVVAIARLEMAGLEANVQEVREPLRPGRDAAFRWTIRASEAGQVRGVVWLHLELVPLAGGSAERVLVLARPIEIAAVTVLGLPAALVRVLGLLSLLFGVVLVYPYVQNRTRQAWQGR